MSSETKNVNWTIGRQPITSSLPAQSGVQYATGGTITVNLDSNYDSDTMILGGTYSAINAGNYVATVTPKSNYCWSDGSYGAKNIDWTLTTQYKTMTVTIDQSNSNPATCCTYADDAVGMTAGSADWDAWFGEYPVLFQNGAEVVKLNPNNFAQDINGTARDITSGSAGDVMIAFPRRGLKISTSGNIITVSMTDDPNKSGFSYYAHQRGSTDKNVFYLGAYKGSEVSSKLRSLSGKTPAVNKTIGSFRTLARNNGGSNGIGGSGYDQSGWYQLIYRQAMYVLKYKNLNSQSEVGKGYTGGGASVSTGATNINGMTYGDKSSATSRVKLFGIEDFWGNVWEWIDGMFSDGSRNILTATQGFNDTGSGYKNNGQGSSANIGWSFADKVQGDTDRGFLIKSGSGSETTYFCDRGSLSASCLPKFGGHWYYGSYAGVFYLIVHDSASCSTSDSGARLMYL